MADPNFRFQLANAIVAGLSPTTDCTCISIIASDMADVLLFTAIELAPCSNYPREAQGWFAGPGAEAEMKATWRHKEGTKSRLRSEPNNSNL